MGLRYEIRRVEETGSTNTDVMALARAGEPEGVVLVTDHQTAGRGRAGRTWTAPPKTSLMCTVLLRPPAKVASLVTFALSVAAAEATESVAGVTAGLKWPNDLVVTGADGITRKLAGILAEAEWPPGNDAASGHREPADHERAVVAAGIGLNVAWPDELPAELAGVAVAINHLTDVEVDRDMVLDALLERLALRYGQLVEGDTAGVLDAWRQRSVTLGQHVRVDLGAEDLEGDAIDVDESGRLVLDTESGRRTVAVGDVVHLRPTT